VAEKTIKLNNVRISFPVLFEAKEFEAGGKKQFSASFIVPKDHPSVAEIKKALAEAATEKWADKGAKLLESLFRDDRLFLHDGDRKDYDGYAGNYFIRANNNSRPLVLDRNKTPLTAQDGKIYSGCFVNAVINIWVQDNKWGKRINANLRGVQFNADGEAFSGGAPADASDFESLEAAAPAADLESLGF